VKLHILEYYIAPNKNVLTMLKGTLLGLQRVINTKVAILNVFGKFLVGIQQADC
jgi:hypothetical protein